MSKSNHPKDFGRLYIFYSVAQHASFSGAAKHLGLSRTMISQAVEGLEASLSVRLFNRTTRSFTMTRQGELLFERAGRMVLEFECAQAEFGMDAAETKGKISLQLPSALEIPAVHGVLAKYMERNPQVTFDMSHGYDINSMAARNVDIALHLGALQDSSLHAKQIHLFRTFALGSAEYFEQFGALLHPNELMRHQVFSYRPLLQGDTWLFRDPDTRQLQAYPMGRISTVDSERTALAFAESGRGIASALEISCTEQVRRGTLIPILRAWTLPIPLSLVYLSKKAMPRCLRLLIDTLAAELPAALSVQPHDGDGRVARGRDCPRRGERDAEG